MFYLAVAVRAANDRKVNGFRIYRFDHDFSLGVVSLIRIGRFANRSVAPPQEPHCRGFVESTRLLDDEVFINHLFE